MPKTKAKKEIPLKEKTTRLNHVLEQFSMIAIEGRINGEFFGWDIRRKSTNLIQAFFRLFEESVASVFSDFSALAVNPDGPVSFTDCKRIVSAIESEFSVKTEQIRQMRYQGGL